MLRTSSMDQRISCGVVLSAFFLGRRVVCVVADCRHHGECEHDERHVAMPAVPGAGFVVIEAEFILGGLEAVLNRPAAPFDQDQGFDARSSRAPGGQECEVAIGDIATDQQSLCPKIGGPQVRSLFVIFDGVEIGEFTIAPVIKPGALGSLARRQPLPC